MSEINAAGGTLAPGGVSEAALPVLTTARLILRPVIRADLPALLRVHGDDAVTRFVPYPSWPGMAEAEAWFERVEGRVARREARQFSLLLRESGQAIGNCVIFNFDQGSARAEIGYILGRDWWGQGYMTEAVGALINLAFEQAGIRRIEAELDARNVASARLLERLGFEREGLLRQRWCDKGEIADALIYGLLHPSGRPQGSLDILFADCSRPV